MEKFFCKKLDIQSVCKPMRATTCSSFFVFEQDGEQVLVAYSQKGGTMGLSIRNHYEECAKNSTGVHLFLHQEDMWFLEELIREEKVF
jgi:hypothetical protein